MSRGTPRAWGWVGHLLAGGTTPWSQWHEEGPAVGRVVPGAQQLELLRRLNGGGRVDERLAARVLEASAPGRGRPDLELVGAVVDSRFGARPVDPAELPEDELLRVAAFLLAEDLVALGPVPRPADALPRPWRRRYRLVGDPLVADPVRRALVARGHGPRAGGEVVVVGTAVPRMLGDAWTARCFERGAAPWEEWVATWRERGQLPPRIDLPRVARTWAGRRGADHVHVVLEPGALPRLVGVRRVPQAPPRPSADAADLSRRIALVLGLMVTHARRAELLRDGLLPRLPEEAFTGPLPAVPDEHRAWVEHRAARMARQLRRAGYPVPGPDAWGDPAGRQPGEPDAQGVLSLAMRMLLGWKELS